MDTGSVVSEPISPHHRSFAKQKSASMTILNPKSCAKYTVLSENNDSITLATQCATTGRRRKGTSISGTLCSRSARGDTKELRSALQDREAVIQNLRIQLCLGKLPRPTGPALSESEKPAAEQKLSRLKTEAENKRIKIKNLKGALDKLDITDNIDTRIRQAELEYALGREELQMLSIVEECRALQARLEKSKPEAQTIYSIISSGVTLSLHAVHATTGRWAAQQRPDQPGFYVEWALEGDGLYKGDRILEVNGNLISCKTKEELQKQIGNTGKCSMVVLRKKSAPIPQKQIDHEKENNMRLQHRISYLEEQVRELQATKEQQMHQQAIMNQNSQNSHVTSISISSPPSTPPDKPLVFQRGNYITTLVGGKPIELLGEDQQSKVAPTPLSKSNSNSHITKTLIKENTHIDLRDRAPVYMMPSKSLSASKISINSDTTHLQQQQQQQQQQHHSAYKREKDRHQRERERYERSVLKQQQQQQQQREHTANLHARSVEHLNQYNGNHDRRRDTPRSMDIQTLRALLPLDMRSVKSLDFDSENEVKPIPTTKSNHEYHKSVETRSVRPTPPKKPLRLSLQRAQSLQTVELHATNDVNNERKRPMKRAHIHEKLSTNGIISDAGSGGNGGGGGGGGGILIENCTPIHTASLGRQKLI